MQIEPRYFDYLPEHGDALEQRIGFNGLMKKIAIWRKQGIDDPDSVAVGCRKAVENIVDSLIDDAGVKRASLVDKIEYAHDEGLIDNTLFYKFNEVRTKGNRGAHGSATIKVIDANMVLELLDDILRALVVDLGIAPHNERTARVVNDELFLIRSDEELASMRKTARTAALLSGDSSIEKEIRQTATIIQKQQKEQSGRLAAFAHLVQQVEELEAEYGIADEGSEEAVAQEQLFARTDAMLDDLRQTACEAQTRAAAAEHRIREILSEHDFVEKLLKGRGRATDSQFDVMAFPRNAKTTTNILQVSGGAGTGKTLCLIAKLISDIREDGQTSLFGKRERRGLFVCFNRGLAQHVRNLMAQFPDEGRAIEVTHYDKYINQLVRVNPDEGYEHLAPFAHDVRYPREGLPGNYRYWNIIYDQTARPLVQEAMATVSAKHPEARGAYYLDGSSAENVEWVNDEILWLEARYENPRTAGRNYPTSPRTGRGTKRRPNETVRHIILEVWEAYRLLLEKKQLYTIEQATKRLQTSQSLPSYDAIAIDEVQDFSIRSIKLLLQLRADEKSRVYISGDENQKIYQRDFTWKELDSNSRGYTIKLTENKRNSEAIEAFARRLLGDGSVYDTDYEKVFVLNASDEKVLRIAQHLRNVAPAENVAIIGNSSYWTERTRTEGLAPIDPRRGNILDPGLYILGVKGGKGLEFDNVIIDYQHATEEDEDAEARLLYVNCTRARKRLYIRYDGRPPELLSKLYPEFVK
ncbi:AAA family ATPase [Adlercreutzia sp. R7]|uniref:AAA family ATPase n=1 Tax=Adlercreutzia wanghongyangiae TaxID=3111451 RepID=A0ABU6IJT7_9ACTN|nr:AAA family ATPase [Adlercreutzia sp. R7]